MKTDDYASQKSEMDEKLELEMDRMSQLRESLSRSDQMTENMLTILTSFESRLMKLEDTITPVYQETGNLQRRHENIEKTLSTLEHVIGYYHVAEEVEPIIREGPSAGLDKYLEFMDKLQKAVDYFTKNNPDSPEMSQVTTLYEAGREAVEKEFRNLLQRHSKTVPAVCILDVLATDDELPNAEPQPIEHLSERVKSELIQMATWLLGSGYNTDYMQIYGTIRSVVVLKSLQCLRDHLKSGSRDSANVSMTHSPALSSKMRTPKESASKNALKRMAFVRKASTTLKHSLAQLEAAGVKRQGSVGGDLKDEGSEIDIDLYITSISGLLKLLQSECVLMQGIILTKHQRKVFDNLIQSSLDFVVKDGEQIASHIRRAVGRHDQQAVLAIFPILKHLRTVKPEFDSTLEGCAAPTRGKLAQLISNLNVTGAKALEEFVENIRNDPDKSSYMPRDGTVHQLTSNTIIFLEQLQGFTDTAGAMLMTQDPTALPTADRPKVKLAEFVTKTLSALGLNLSNKSETYGDATLRSIFMLNNYNYILNSLKRSGLLSLIHTHWNTDVQKYYDDQILEQKRLYSHSWSKVLHHIMMDMNKTARSPTEAKLKDKERQSIKDRFTGFNKEVEEIRRIQKTYAIPDPDMRRTLKQENRDYVIPSYQAFLDKYTATNFTKNPDKYIKYSVADVGKFIEQFFDSAA